MIKKIIGALCVISAAAAFSTAAYAEDTVYKTMMSFNFDGIEDGQISSYSENDKSVYIDNKETAYISGDMAPEGKQDGTSLSEEGSVDKVMVFNLGSKSQNPNARFSFSAGDFTGNLKLSYNFYVPQCTNASYGLFNTDIRNSSDSSSYNVIASLRGNKNFQYYPTINAATNNGTFTTGKWHHAEVLINASERTYSLYINGVLKGENCALKDGTLFNEIRFSTNNTSQNLSNTCVYLDDVFMGVETERPTPVFLKTEHESGVENTDTGNVPKDMTGITVQFPFDMDETSFDGNVSLTRGSDKTEVPFTGVYNSENKTFTAVLNEKAVPCTEYNLTIGKNVKTSEEQSDQKYAGVYLTTPEVITVTTEKVDFAVVNSFFSSDESGTNKITDISEVNDTVYGNVEIVSSDLLEDERQVTAFVICYQNGMMSNVWQASAVAQPSADIERNKITVSAPISGIQIDDNTRFELIVWDSFKNQLPLFGGIQIGK